MKIHFIFKKLVAVFLSLVLSIGLSILVSAESSENSILVTETMEYYNSGNLNLGSNTKLKSFETNKKYSEQWFYSYYLILNDLQKQIYRGLIRTTETNDFFTIVLENPITLDEYNSINFQLVSEAFSFDHPELFYIGGIKYGYRYKTDPTTSERKIVEILFKVDLTKLNPNGPYIYKESDIKLFDEKMWNEFNKVPVDLSNRYNFVKSVHDYLCKNVTYVNNQNSCHDPYGTLVEKEAVCQGYAETFKMFCDYYSIPCIYISGKGVTQSGEGPHGWNAVQMDDGNWYLTDVTWDDQEENGTFYCFFLSGLNTKPFDSANELPFNKSHIPDKNGYIPSLNYSDEKYAETNHNTLFKATYNSLADYSNKIITLSAFDAPKHNIYYHGMKVNVDSKFTGAKFTVNGNEQWKMILLGDVNCDGNCNIDDYITATNEALGSSAAISQDAISAADIYKDNVIDVLDLSLLQRYCLGKDNIIKVN